MLELFDVEPMAKIRVLCSKQDLDSAVQALYDFGAIHVTRSKAFRPGQPLPKLEPVSAMLVKVRAAESALALKPNERSQRYASPSLRELEKEFNSIPFEEMESAWKERQELESKLNDLQNKESELKPFKHLQLNLNSVRTKTQLLEFALFEVTSNEEKALDKAREFGQAVLLKEGKQTKLLAAWDKRKSEKARHALSQYAREVSLPQAGESFSREYGDLKKRIAQAEKQLEAAKINLGSFALKHGGKIISLKNALEIEFKKAELPSKFGQSELAACAEGWIPKKDYRTLEKTLNEKLGEKVLVEKIETQETPPSKLKNSYALRPFEFMIEFFSLPNYKEIDPTFFTAITFPLFFGMILGDMGYGLILLLMGAFFFFKFKKGAFHSIGGMLSLSALSTIIFGFIYAEIFGVESFLGYEFHPIISRANEQGIGVLFALSVLIGFLHVTLGLLLGAWQGLREKDVRHSAGKIAWLAVLFGFIAFITNSMHLIFTEYLQFLRIIPPPFDLGLFVLGAAGLVYFEGPVQLFEIPSLFSNVLSYLRIMALGLSGVALAGMVASIPLDFNSLATLQPGAIVSFILFAVLLILGHAVAIALGLLEAGIQSLRLHYVEFYSKFYKGGGIPFVPLRED